MRCRNLLYWALGISFKEAEAIQSLIPLGSAFRVRKRALGMRQEHMSAGGSENRNGLFE
jgi:hypothetical protein